MSTNPQTVNFSLQIPRSLHARLKRLALKRLTSASAVAREILTQHVATKRDK